MDVLPSSILLRLSFFKSPRPHESISLGISGRVSFISARRMGHPRQPAYHITVFKGLRLSRKVGQRIGPQSHELRVAWQADMLHYTAEQLVFIDESLFKMQTCWRSMAYSAIGEPARWRDNITRGDTWSILPPYTTDGYLPCTGIRKGYFGTENFLLWIENRLLPHLNPYPEPCSVVCLDNVSIHLDPRI